MYLIRDVDFTENHGKNRMDSMYDKSHKFVTIKHQIQFFG